MGEGDRERDLALRAKREAADQFLLPRRDAPGQRGPGLRNAAAVKSQFSVDREAGVQAKGLRDVPDPAAGRDRREPPRTAVSCRRWGRSRPSSSRMSVVFPAPFAPSSPTTSPGPTVRSTADDRREPAEAPCCRAGFGEEPHRVTSAATMLAGERGSDHGVLEVRRYRPRALRERASRVPYPPGGAAPPRQRGGPLGAVHDAEHAGDVVQDLRRGAAGCHLPGFQQHHHGGAGCLVHVGRG